MRKAKAKEREKRINKRMFYEHAVMVFVWFFITNLSFLTLADPFGLAL
jgi:hypothetical protein